MMVDGLVDGLQSGKLVLMGGCTETSVKFARLAAIQSGLGNSCMQFLNA